MAKNQEEWSSLLSGRSHRAQAIREAKTLGGADAATTWQHDTCKATWTPRLHAADLGMDQSRILLALDCCSVRTSRHAACSAVGHWAFFRGTARNVSLIANYVGNGHHRLSATFRKSRAPPSSASATDVSLAVWQSWQSGSGSLGLNEGDSD